MTVEPANVRIDSLPFGATFIDPNNFGIYEVAQVQTTDIAVNSPKIPAIRHADGALFAYAPEALVIPKAYKVIAE